MSLTVVGEILDRAHSGPICPVSKWDGEVVPEKTQAKLKERGLVSCFKPDSPISSDNGLADEFYRAAFELAAELGMLCVNTERIIQVGEDELREAIKMAPREMAIGEGVDARMLVHREPEDSRKPLMCCPLGIVVSEDLWIPIMQGIYMNSEIDMTEGASLATAFGHEVLSATPFETLLGRVQAQMHREALWRAGRQGMHVTGMISSVTDLAQFTGYGVPGIFKPNDFALVLSPAELKTVYMCLNKVIHALSVGGRVKANAASFIGGYAGSVEGAVLVNIASALLRMFVHQSCICSLQIMDMRYNGNAGREGMWGSSVALQALSRNTHMILDIIIDQTAGPNTEMLLYETAVGMMNFSVSGTSYSTGPRSAGGKWTNHLTPLECKFSGEVIKACAGMKRTNANEIAKKIIPKYERTLLDRTSPKGDAFTECYDMKTLRPNKEWLGKYNKVKKELVDLGMPLS